ncbi:phospholipid/glycerol acyltransferase [Crinalium epipsammum PCC 9333]|uniref:Phospholipid/glycerol acyltransferase n=1 Tax=Crinalium epipsammum PCC 9333 TaxID=1173022 RepID=K9W4M4_9CYAN|nr:phospholipid/glycerol acyltransferase [Crinalium epipsammum]AFZ14405.1 phospholipid/glycerol acyltransferase [Crinalium epipsammum PCC 9333]
MSNPVIQAQPPLEFIPPAFNPLVVQGVKMLLPIWLRSRTSITEIKADNVETLVDLYQQFQSGKTRFLMAFRHPSADDPFSLLYLISYILPQVAKQKGIPLQKPLHSHFMYDRGIPIWAGSIVSWLYPRLGGTSIHRGKLDRVGLRSARNLLVNGNFPLAAAPEGATNGHNELVSPLEPGIAQLGFWCAEDLLKAERSEQVFIVPIGIKYSYVQAPWKQIEQLLTTLEADSGLSANSENSQFKNQQLVSGVEPSDEVKKWLYKRVYKLGEHFLSLMENFYTKFYHQKLPTAHKKEFTSVTSTEELESQSLSYKEFSTRLHALLDVALQVAEQYFNVLPKGSLIDRCRRLEQAGWDCIYREDIKNPEKLSALEKGLADRIAAEANLRMWHMRLVESFVSVTGKYILEKPTADRFAETTLLMWDMMTRIKGGNPFMRPKLGKQRVQMTIGEPISVSERWDTYSSSRRSAKQSVENLTQDIQTAFESMI